MGRLEDRLSRIEDAAASSREHVIPVHVRLLVKYMERHRAFEEGREPPSYTDEELNAKYQSDLETAAGEGVVGWLRGSAGWARPQEQQLLAIWEEQARRRVEAARPNACPSPRSTMSGRERLTNWMRSLPTSMTLCFTTRTNSTTERSGNDD